MDLLQNVDDDFIVLVLTVFTVIICLTFGIYFLYMMNLQSRECSMLDSLYQNNMAITSVVPGENNLNNYYIKTAYNCCSLGSYKNDFVGICGLKSVLKQGVRGLDFEIFSMDDIPVISTSTTSNYYTKETYNSIDFNEAMNVIANTAFSGVSGNSKDPIIIHLRFKSNNIKMYQKLALILQNYDALLIDKKYNNVNLGIVPLKHLMGKISIIVNGSNTKTYKDCYELLDYINMNDDSGFIRMLTYYDVKFSDPQNSDLPVYNKKYMTICVPDKGDNPSNPDYTVFTDAGCNMIAMRYQHIDQYLELNNTFFKDKAFRSKT
jgi:hypothetical protein